MKRTIIILVAFGYALGLHAQGAAASADTLGRSEKEGVSLILGLQGGATLYASTYDNTPYYSKYGLFARVPLMLNYSLSQRWRLSAGLRYDLCFDPFYYAVERNWEMGQDGIPRGHGLDFAGDSVSGRQHAYALRNYVGIPVEFTWYPYPHDKRLLSVSFDLYAGYAFANLVSIGHRVMVRTIDGSEVAWGDESPFPEELASDDPTLLPWRLELGVTVATDVIGLIHGVRLFGSLLPSYRDPLTGEAIYNFGMSFYL